MLLKILLYLLVLYLLQRMVRHLLFPRSPEQRVGGRRRRSRVVDPGQADIEDARFKDLE